MSPSRSNLISQFIAVTLCNQCFRERSLSQYKLLSCSFQNNECQLNENSTLKKLIQFRIELIEAILNDLLIKLNHYVLLVCILFDSFESSKCVLLQENLVFKTLIQSQVTRSRLYVIYMILNAFWYTKPALNIFF